MDHLGLVAGILDEIGIEQKINQFRTYATALCIVAIS
ncbi:MAG: hypothetical protein O4753_00795 [Trichodesmium sp. St7_bin2_1]|nr:hypothetical protein [Trichodesmium sp. St7_bin2_1]